MPYQVDGSLLSWRHKWAAQPQPSPLTLKQVAHLLTQAADALQHAHAHQILHQDVKPANFLLRRRAPGPQSLDTFPDLLLADFGMARLEQATTTMSQVIETPTYMAPEQWAGRACAASDQYALAIMTYELLTGQVPFQGSSPDVIYAHLNKLPQPPSVCNPSLSSDLDTVLLKALAKQPEHRYPSITTFAQACLAGMGEHTVHEFDSTHTIPSLLSQGGAGTVELTSLPSPFIQRGDTSLQMEQDATRSSALSFQRGADPLPPPPPVLRKRSPLRRERTNLLIALIIFLVLVVSGLAVIIPTIQQTQNASSARSTASVLALNATLNADTNASGTAAAVYSTAIAQNAPDPNLYQQATSSPPVLDDSLQRQGSGKWDISQNKDGSFCGFTNGRYHVKEAMTGYILPCYEHARTFHNFAFQVTLTFITGNVGGMMFRADRTTNQEYLLEINVSGQYNLYVYTGSQASQSLLSGTADNVGTSGTIELTLIAQDTTFYVYVDGQFADRTTDLTVTSGLVGLVADARPQTTEVVYSNARVWLL